MAAALQKKKDEVIMTYLKEKRASRTWKQKLRYFWIKLKRKFRK
jgi:hypothetical protein